MSLQHTGAYGRLANCSIVTSVPGIFSFITRTLFDDDRVREDSYIASGKYSRFAHNEFIACVDRRDET